MRLLIAHLFAGHHNIVAFAGCEDNEIQLKNVSFNVFDLKQSYAQTYVSWVIRAKLNETFI